MFLLKPSSIWDNSHTLPVKNRIHAGHDDQGTEPISGKKLKMRDLMANRTKNHNLSFWGTLKQTPNESTKIQVEQSQELFQLLFIFCYKA